MSNEEFYDNDLDLTDPIDDVDEGLAAEEFEIELHRRSPKGDVFLQIFPRTRYWLRVAVRPEEIIREDKEDLVFVFVKKMRDPVYEKQEGGIRYIKFRCSIALSELEIEMCFSHVEISYVDPEGNITESEQVFDKTPEADSVKEVFEQVINHLSAYLTKS